jgi:hypothetical protein
MKQTLSFVVACLLAASASIAAYEPTQNGARVSAAPEAAHAVVRP